MRNVLSLVFSIAAMVASGLTTYVTFYQDRYTLTIAVAEIVGSLGTSTYRAGPQSSLEVVYRVFFEPTLILSNQGTRALVLTDLQMIPSTSLNDCVPSEETRRPAEAVKPVILEPDSVRDLSFEFGRGNMTNDFETRSELWCIKLTVFDSNGTRMEPMFEAFRADYRLEAAIGADGSGDLSGDAPALSLTIDFPRRPVVVAQTGFALGRLLDR